MFVIRHAQSTQNNFAYLWNISRKVSRMKLNFCLQINTKVFYKLIVSLWVSVARHAQIIQNNKFTISLQYLEKEVSDTVDFLHEQASKKACYNWYILWFLMRMVKYFQSPRNSKFAMSLQNLKKEVRGEVDFLHADKHQSFLLVDFNTLAIKVTYKMILLLLMDMIKHSQSNKFAISLQYLKKEVRNGVHFFLQINIKTSRWHYHFWWKWPEMSKVPKTVSW